MSSEFLIGMHFVQDFIERKGTPHDDAGFCRGSCQFPIQALKGRAPSCPILEGTRLLCGGHSPPKLDTVRLLEYECAPRMLGFAKLYFIVFGILTIVGGLIGYLKAGSTISLVSGSIAGILLVLAAFLLPTQLGAGLAIALGVSLLLAGRFIPHLIKTGKVMPDAMMSVLSVIGIVLAVLAWLKK